MDIDVLFRIAGIGIIVAIVNQLLSKADKGEYAVFVTLSGVIIIILREFAVSGIRLVAVDNGSVIAASNWGKAKTITQMAMIIFFLIDIPQLKVISQIVMYIALVLTLISMFDYLQKNKDVIKFE